MANIERVSPEQAVSLAVEFLVVAGEDRDSIEVQLELHIEFLAVCKFAIKKPNRETPVQGWIIGGNIPHLELNADEIRTPLEALAIYSLYLYDWIAAKGIEDPEGSVPIYRTPPDFEPLSFHPGFKESRIGAITYYISWSLIPINIGELHHPEIREKCRRRGWLREDLYGDSEKRYQEAQQEVIDSSSRNSPPSETK